MKKFYSLLLSLFLAVGCGLTNRQLATQPTTQPIIVTSQPASRPAWEGEVSIRPIIVIGADGSPWNDKTIFTRVNFAADMFQRQVNLRLCVLPTKYVKNDTWFNINCAQDRLELAALSEKYSGDNELAVFFVGTITDESGRDLAGEAFYPFTSLKTCRHGIFIASKVSSFTVLAHELGHSFGLPHVKDVYACPSCNIMSYCDQRILDECQFSLLTEDQVRTIQIWATRSPRNQVVRVLSNIDKTVDRSGVDTWSE